MKGLTMSDQNNTLNEAQQEQLMAITAHREITSRGGHLITGGYKITHEAGQLNIFKNELHAEGWQVVNSVTFVPDASDATKWAVKSAISTTISSYPPPPPRQLSGQEIAQMVNAIARLLSL
jgi:hypothetical protein